MPASKTPIKTATESKTPADRKTLRPLAPADLDRVTGGGTRPPGGLYPT